VGQAGAGCPRIPLLKEIIFRHVSRECKLIPKCLFLCFWNSGDARKYKGKHFFFFFCCGNSLLEWNVGHPDPLASHLQLSLFQWGHGVAAWRKGEEGHFRSILQLQSINPSTTPSTSFKRGILGQPAPACPTNLQTQSSLQVLKYYLCSSCL